MFVTKYDAKIYNEGGLGRCSEKLLECLEAYKEGHPQFEAAKHLRLLVCRHAHEIFAIDIFYHKKCYSSFALCKTPRRSLEEEQVMQELALKEANVLDNFMQLFEQKVIFDA